MRKEQIPLIDRADNLHHRNQILTVAGVTLALFATGNMMGYSSLTIPELLSPESFIKTTHEDLSWIASLVALGTIGGSLIGGVLSDAIGRKKTIILVSILFCGGWVVIAKARTVRDILIGRLMTGMASGSYSASVQVYICEIVVPSLRGVTGALPSLSVTVGILTIYCIGSLFEWQTAAYVCSTFPIVVLLYTLCLPESPVWLIDKGRQPEALKSLAWLRNDREEAEQECMRLQYLKERRISGGFSFKNCCSRFCDPSVLKPLGMGSALFFFQQFSGIYPITFYATLIFQYTNNFMNDYLETIAVGFVRMFATFIALFLVKFLNRRLLLISSSIICALSTGVLGGYFYMRESAGDTGNSTEISQSIIVKYNDVNLEWLPLACLLLFMVSYSCGIGIIPWVFIAEILPSDVRGLGCAIAIGFCQICLFVAVKTFLDMIEWLDTFGTFWFYSAVSLSGALFIAVFVPETSHLHCGEIEAIFDNSGSVRNGHGLDEEGVDETSNL